MLQSLQLALRFYYDTLGRLASRKIGLSSDYITTLTYVPGNGTNKTTGLVSTYQNGSDAAYQYEYDANGNITHIQQGDTHLYYQYDALNQLVREDNSLLNKSITYTYDDRGNILNKTEYAYVANGGTLGAAADTITYGYESEYQAWADQLTSYDGEAIRYDASGNPTTYRGYTMAWQGRRLTGATNGTNTISYSYDENGIRTQKTVNGTVTNYNYHGSALISQVTGNDTLLFSYDAAGNVVAVNYNGTYYYYVRNGQNDVIRLIDGESNTVVEYAYDSWGTPLSTTGTLATTLGVQNPFRYRGYVCDTETGLYYLQSRYYDPELSRFISADVYMSTGQGVLGHNMFAYCLNNPQNLVDNTGATAEAASTWLKTMWWLCALDGSLPVGEIAYCAFALVLLCCTAEADAELVDWVAQCSRAQTHEEAKEIAREETFQYDPPQKERKYIGLRLTSGVLVPVTGYMTTEEAYLWAMTTTSFGKNASWGLYTQKKKDAELMIRLLGASSFIEDVESNAYPHLHFQGHNWYREDGFVFKHFHVWYGEIM